MPAERVAAREWYRDAKFGMFIHWGVYSLLGQGEWVMQNRSIAEADYEWLAGTFNPQKFDARAWALLAKSAGMKYITITARHHDGFSMFATRATRYNIVDWTPFRRDPLRELAEECRRQGIRLFFYYSQLDWHHANYFPRGSTGQGAGRQESGDWSRYLDFMDTQLTELLTNYGSLGGIWFDGMWDKPEADWRLGQTYALIHRLQPAALVIPNHHKAPLAGEDVQTFEQDLPGANTAGFNTREVGGLPLETSLTMNESWGFNLTDHKYKSPRELIGYLVRAAGYGANLLLNIGPRPDGTIPPEAEERLRAIGSWLATYGGSIYGTRAGPIAPRSWGVTTERPHPPSPSPSGSPHPPSPSPSGRGGDTVFVHVLDWKDPTLALPSLGPGRWTARSWPDGKALALVQTAGGMMLTLPPVTEQPDRVVVLTRR